MRAALSALVPSRTLLSFPPLLSACDPRSNKVTGGYNALAAGSSNVRGAARSADAALAR